MSTKQKTVSKAKHVAALIPFLKAEAYLNLRTACPHPIVDDRFAKDDDKVAYCRACLKYVGINPNNSRDDCPCLVYGMREALRITVDRLRREEEISEGTYRGMLRKIKLVVE